MRRKKDRIIIDTNLWITFLLSSDFSKLDRIFRDNSAVLLFSEELLKEFVDVISRPKFKKYFSAEDLRDLLKQIEIKAEFVQVFSEVTVCRDLKDNFLLSLAKDGKATHLISGDKDLTSLEKYEQTRILTLTEYIASSQ